MVPKLAMNRWKKRARADTMIRPKKAARNWLDLPPDLLCMILMQLDAVEILSSVQFVCSSWYNMCKQPHLWHVIHIFNCSTRDNYFPQTNKKYQRMLANALHRSCGQAVHITISCFGTDPSLLQCSSLQHSRQAVRRVRVDFNDFSETFSGRLNADNLLTVGLCCPLLKTLKLKKVFRVPSGYVIHCIERLKQTLERVEGCDMEAFVIAKTMRNLRCLEIVGNTLTDCGLHAVLDACPHLEHLDLTDCHNLTFRGQLRQKCAERIKTLKLPSGI